MVSVIIPTYNRAELLKRSIQSVLEQTYSDLELIIVDDGSTDDTEKVVSALNDSRIRYIKQKNQGACVARNLGIDNARGEYIAFQDSDDVWHRNKLEVQLEALIKNNADVVFCKMDRIRNGKKNKFPINNFKEGFFTKDICPFTISTQTLLGRAEVFKDERFDPLMPRWQDFEILLRIVQKYSLYCIDKSLADYYIQNDSISMNHEKLLVAWKRILEKNPDFCDVYPEALEAISLKFLTMASQETNVKLKNEFLKISLSLKKSHKVLIKAFLVKTNLYPLYLKVIVRN